MSISLVACQCDCPVQPELANPINQDSNFIYHSAVNMRCTTLCIGDHALFKSPMQRLKATKTPTSPTTSLPHSLPPLDETSDQNKQSLQESIALADSKAPMTWVSKPSDHEIRQKRSQLAPTLHKPQALLRYLRQQQHLDQLDNPHGNQKSKLEPYRQGLITLTDNELYLHHLRSTLRHGHYNSSVKTQSNQNHPQKADFSHFGANQSKSELDTTLTSADNGFFNLNFDHFGDKNNSTPRIHLHSNSSPLLPNENVPDNQCLDINRDNDFEFEEERLNKALIIEYISNNRSQEEQTFLLDRGKNSTASLTTHNQYNSSNRPEHDSSYLSPEHSTFTNSDGYQLGKIVGLLLDKNTRKMLCVYSLYRFDHSNYVIQTDTRLITNILNIVDHAFILSHQDVQFMCPIPSIFDSIHGGHIHTHTNHHNCSQYFDLIQNAHQQDTAQSKIARSKGPLEALPGPESTLTLAQLLAHNPNHGERQFHTQQVYICQYLQQGSNPMLIPVIPSLSSSTLASNSQLSVNQAQLMGSQNSSVGLPHSNTNPDSDLKLTSKFSDLDKLRAYSSFVHSQFRVVSHYIPRHEYERVFNAKKSISPEINLQDSFATRTALPTHLAVEPSLLGLYKKSLEPGYIGVSMGSPLNERQNEFKTIYQFLLHGIGKRHAGGALLLSGLPGTGKTATVNQTINRLEEEAKSNSVPRHTVVRLNATQLRDPKEIWPLLLQGLTMTHSLAFFIAKNASPKLSMTILHHLIKRQLDMKAMGRGISGLFGVNDEIVSNNDSKSKKTNKNKSTKKAPAQTDSFLHWVEHNVHPNDYSKHTHAIMNAVRPEYFGSHVLEYCIFILDEADYMITSHQKELYMLLDFPSNENLPLSILLISNTFSLWEKSLRILSRVGLKQLAFESYSYQNISTIIKSRLEQANKQFVNNLGQYYRHCLTNNCYVNPKLLYIAIEQIVQERNQANPASKKAITMDNVEYTLDELVIALSFIRYKQSHSLIGLDDEAIRFTSMRVAQLSGDCRKALDLTTKAITIAANNRATSQDKVHVNIECINEAIKSTSRSIGAQFVKSFGRNELFVLASLMLLTVSFSFITKKVSNLHHRNYISLNELYGMYIKLLKKLDLFDHPAVLSSNEHDLSSQPSKVKAGNNHTASKFDRMMNQTSSTSLLSRLSTRVTYPKEVIILDSLQNLSMLHVIGVSRLSKLNHYVIYWINGSMKEECVNFLLGVDFIQQFLEKADFYSVFDAEIASRDDNDSNQLLKRKWDDNNVISYTGKLVNPGAKANSVTDTIVDSKLLSALNDSSDEEHPHSRQTNSVKRQRLK
jgi:Cdc6-like AAA superfamily ATPase